MNRRFHIHIMLLLKKKRYIKAFKTWETSLHAKVFPITMYSYLIQYHLQFAFLYRFGALRLLQDFFFLYMYRSSIKQMSSHKC